MTPPKLTLELVNDELPILDNVFEAPEIVLLVNVCVVLLNNVSIWDKFIRPSVPPSDANSLSDATSVWPVKSVALSIFTIA